MKMILMWSVMIFGIGLVTPTLGQELPSEYDKPSSEEDGEVEVDSGKFGLHFQVGLLGRFIGEPIMDNDTKWLFNADLSFTGLGGNRATWGIGLHLAGDDGIRYGPKFLWRIPLGPSGRGYFQVAPGIYVGGEIEVFSLDAPGYLLELELGYTNYIALVVAVEGLKYKPMNNSIYYSSVGDASESEMFFSGYMGAKIGQWPGLLTLAIGFGVAAASLGASGGL